MTDNNSTDSHEINIAHLARLAQLALNSDAQAAVARDLNNIIGMIDAMAAVDTEGVAPMAHPHDSVARLRKDEVTESVDPEHFQKHAPDVADGYYLVPRVVE